MKKNTLKKGLVLALVLGLIGGGITICSGGNGNGQPDWGMTETHNIVENC